MKCQWFLRCYNEATTTQAHPILGDVPCCQRCKQFAAPQKKEELTPCNAYDMKEVNRNGNQEAAGEVGFQPE